MADAVEAQVTSGSTKLAGLIDQMEPDLMLRTGLTEGRRFDIVVRPREGRPVLIAVHL